MGGQENLLQATEHFSAFLRMSKAADLHGRDVDPFLQRAQVMIHLCNISLTCGDKEQAIAWLEKAETEFSHVQSSNSSKLQICGNELTFHREMLGQSGQDQGTAGQLAACHKLHAAYVSSPEAGPKAVGVAAMNITLTLARQRRFAEACKWLEEERATQGNSALLYVECLEEVGRTEEALVAVEPCVSKMEQSHGPEHSETISVRHRLCGILDALGHHQRAQELTTVNIRMQQRWQHSGMYNQQLAGQEKSGTHFMMQKARALLAYGEQHASSRHFTDARIAFGRALNRLRVCAANAEGLEECGQALVSCLCRRAECYMTIRGDSGHALRLDAAKHDCEEAEEIIAEHARRQHGTPDAALSLAGSRLAVLMHWQELAAEGGGQGGESRAAARAEKAGRESMEIQVVKGGGAALAFGATNDDECPICMEGWASITRAVVLLPCLHIVCKPCMSGWAQGCKRGFPEQGIKHVPVTCPCCRARVPGGAKALEAARSKFERGN